MSGRCLRDRRGLARPGAQHRGLAIFGALAGVSALAALFLGVLRLSLLIVSLHGQVEPVALAFALGGVLLARQQRWLLAGVLLGTAVAAKSWPLLILLAVIPATQPRRAASLLGGAVVVPALMLASGVIFLDTHPVAVIKHVASYTSLVQDWGWGGLLVSLGVRHVGGYGTEVGHISSVLTGLAVIATLIVFRRGPHHPGGHGLGRFPHRDRGLR